MGRPPTYPYTLMPVRFTAKQLATSELGGGGRTARPERFRGLREELRNYQEGWFRNRMGEVLPAVGKQAAR